MTDLELAEYIAESNRRKAKKDYFEYLKYVHGGLYKENRHGKFIANVLNEAIEIRKKQMAYLLPIQTQYFMFNLPPQHGKSMTITETFPSYFKGQFQDEGAIILSYNDTFAERFGSLNKDKIGAYGDTLFNARIARGSNSKTDWEVANASNGRKFRGGVISRGIMGGVTGSSYGDLIIIDDPVKNREEASSETYRNKVWNEWKDSISTRIHPGGIVILIMTRWHEDDLAGRLMNPEYGEPLDWKVYSMPLECEEDNDILGRKIGEPLWAEKYGYEFIEERKRYPDSFNALYQGRPTAEGGNIIKKDWWKFYDELPLMMQTILSVDASFKDTKTSDSVSIQVWGKRGADLYLIDNVTKRMGFIATILAIKNILLKHPKVTAKYIEDKANGSAIIEELRREIGGVIPVKADRGTGGKVARVQAISPFIEAGNVYLPRGKGWVNGYIEEWAAFPNGKHDDQVDCASQAIAKMCHMVADVPEKESVFNFKHERPKANEFTGIVTSEFTGGW